MKSIKILAFALCLLLLLPLVTACVWERHELLYEVEVNGLSYFVRGKNGRVKQIVVKEKGKAIWSKTIATDREMPKVDDAYGFSVQDLNFDGRDDILIATEKNGDCVTYECYIREGREAKYTLSEELSSMYNVKADARLEAIFAFDTSREARGDDAYISCDKVTKYFWKNGYKISNGALATRIIAYFKLSDFIKDSASPRLPLDVEFTINILCSTLCKGQSSSFVVYIKELK